MSQVPNDNDASNIKGFSCFSNGGAPAAHLMFSSPLLKNQAPSSRPFISPDGIESDFVPGGRSVGNILNSECIQLPSKRHNSGNNEPMNREAKRQNLSQEFNQNENFWKEASTISLSPPVMKMAQKQQEKETKAGWNNYDDDGLDLTEEETRELFAELTQPDIDLSDEVLDEKQECDKMKKNGEFEAEIIIEGSSSERKPTAQEQKKKKNKQMKSPVQSILPFLQMHGNKDHYSSSLEKSNSSGYKPEQKKFKHGNRMFIPKDTWSSTKKDLEEFSFTISNVIKNQKSVLPNQQEAVISAVYKPLVKTFIGEEEGRRLLEKRKKRGIKDYDQVNYVSMINLSFLKKGRIPLRFLTTRVSPASDKNDGDSYSDLMYENKKANTSDVMIAYRYKTESFKQQNFTKRRFGKPTVLDLFAGGGGMCLGFEKEGFDVLCHVDHDRCACDTLEKNFTQSIVVKESVSYFLQNCRKMSCKRNRFYFLPGDFDHIHGSPPCQGFSTANVYGGKNDDANNASTGDFVMAVKYFLPLTASMENAMGMMRRTRNKRGYLEKVVTDLLLIDYQVRLCFPIASDYGDPQARQRVILLAAKKGIKLPDVPRRTHGDEGLAKSVSVRDVLRCLEEIKPLCESGLVELKDGTLVWDHCMDGAPKIFGNHTTNKNVVQLVADKPTLTLKKNNQFLHYSQRRCLTIRELALLQSFPIDYKFAGDHRAIRNQIGNAVPICLARAVAKTIMTSYAVQ